MCKKNGFSLTEVLMALAIFSLSSLSLFKHQWLLTKALQYQKKQLLAQEIFDDVAEFNIAKHKISTNLTNKIHSKLHGSLSNTLYGNEKYYSLTFTNFDGETKSNHTLKRCL